MSYALGQPVPLRIQVTDETGALDDATTVVLTVTLPDGTSVTPTVTHAGTGIYTVDYTPTVAGLHAVRWVATGTNASAPPLDVFYVEQSLPPLVSLAEARKQCGLSSTTDDALVQRIALVAADLCEQHTKIWRRTPMTVTRDGGDTELSLPAPVASITTVTEDGVTLTSSDWVLDAVRGKLLRGTATSVLRWSWGRQNIVVTLVAGAVDGIIPTPIRQGNLALIKHLWDFQRGGALPRRGEDFTMPPGFTIPNAVLEEWDPWISPLVA